LPPCAESFPILRLINLRPAAIAIVGAASSKTIDYVEAEAPWEIARRHRAAVCINSHFSMKLIPCGSPRLLPVERSCRPLAAQRRKTEA